MMMNLYLGKASQVAYWHFVTNQERNNMKNQHISLHRPVNMKGNLKTFRDTESLQGLWHKYTMVMSRETAACVDVTMSSLDLTTCTIHRSSRSTAEALRLTQADLLCNVQQRIQELVYRLNQLPFTLCS
jgi:hypothetical protein